MNLLSRYVGMQVALAITLVLVVILSLDLLGAILDEVSRIDENYTFIESIRYLLMTLPGRLINWLPFSALVGCLAGLGSLANNSELTVMRAAGISTRRIIWIVLQPTLVVVILGVLVNEYVAPVAEKSGKARRDMLRSGQQVLSARTGFWNREGNDFMHVNAVYPDGTLGGVLVYRFDDQRRLKETIVGQRASFEPEQDSWLVTGVTRTKFYPDAVRVRQVDDWRWHTRYTPDLLDLIVLDPRQLSMSSLWKYANYRTSQGLEAAQYKLAFWSKALQPLSIISLVLVAISFVFGPLREVTMGYRVFAGVIVGIVFWILQELLGPASLVFNFPPMHAVAMPIALSFALGLFLLRKV